MGRIRAVVVAAGLLVAAAPAAAQAAKPQLPPALGPGPLGGVAFNGPVAAIALDAGSSRAFLGGGFTRVGPLSGGSVVVDPATRTTALWPRIEGTVFSSVPDGQGGVYVGGAFGAVGGEVRLNVAHIGADGLLDRRFFADTDGPVQSLARLGDTLYIGGDFRTVNGQPRRRLAAVDAPDGNVTPLDPRPDGPVEDLVTDGRRVFASGEFRGFAGRSRHGLAAFDPSTGALDPAFDVVYGGSIDALLLNGGKLYVGGTFTSLQGRNRSSLAAFDAVTGELDRDFSPSVDGSVFALEADGDALWAGGGFFEVAGQRTRGVARLDARTGAADPRFVMTTDRDVYALDLQDGRLLAGGQFLYVDGVAQPRLAILDPQTGTPDFALNLDPDGEVFTVGAAPGGTLVGGNFTSAPRQRRYGVVAIDRTSGQVDPGFAAAAVGRTGQSGVRALAFAGGRLWLGGTFDRVDGARRANLAAIDAATGAVDALEVRVRGEVHALAAAGGRLLVGGAFSRVGRTRRFGLAAVDPVTGAVDAAFPDARGIVRRRFRDRKKRLKIVDEPVTGSVDALLADGDGVYVGGAFGRFGGGLRYRQSLVRVGLGDGRIDDRFAARLQPYNEVAALAKAGSTLYVGGGVGRIVGYKRVRKEKRAIVRTNLIGMDASTGALAKPFLPDVDGPVQALLPIPGGRLLVGGGFTVAHGYVLRGLAVLDAGTGAADPLWAPQPRGSVQALGFDGERVLAGGTFEGIGLGYEPGFARLPPPAPAP